MKLKDFAESYQPKDRKRLIDLFVNKNPIIVNSDKTSDEWGIELEKILVIIRKDLTNPTLQAFINRWRPASTGNQKVCIGCAKLAKFCKCVAETKFKCSEFKGTEGHEYCGHELTFSEYDTHQKIHQVEHAIRYRKYNLREYLNIACNGDALKIEKHCKTFAKYGFDEKRKQQMYEWKISAELVQCWILAKRENPEFNYKVGFIKHGECDRFRKMIAESSKKAVSV